MIKRQLTLKSEEHLRLAAVILLLRGFKRLGFGEKRVPNGTQVKLTIKLRTWHGEWAGYASHTAAVFYE